MPEVRKGTKRSTLASGSSLRAEKPKRPRPLTNTEIDDDEEDYSLSMLDDFQSSVQARYLQPLDAKITQLQQQIAEVKRQPGPSGLKGPLRIHYHTSTATPDPCSPIEDSTLAYKRAIWSLVTLSHSKILPWPPCLDELNSSENSRLSEMTEYMSQHSRGTDFASCTDLGASLEQTSIKMALESITPSTPYPLELVRLLTFTIKTIRDINSVSPHPANEFTVAPPFHASANSIDLASWESWRSLFIKNWQSGTRRVVGCVGTRGREETEIWSAMDVLLEGGLLTIYGIQDKAPVQLMAFVQQRIPLLFDEISKLDHKASGPSTRWTVRYQALCSSPSDDNMISHDKSGPFAIQVLRLLELQPMSLPRPLLSLAPHSSRATLLDSRIDSALRARHFQLLYALIRSNLVNAGLQRETR